MDLHGGGVYRNDDGGWNSICLVVPKSNEPMELYLPDIGLMLLNEITQTIIAKMLFLLFPTNNSGFLNQLKGKSQTHAATLD